MPTKKEIVYPVFLECCGHADDVFWENIFEDLAYGKPPYGTYISKGFLCCSYKNKEFSYKIERKESKILYEEIYKLLTEKLGILSHKEKAKKRLDFYEIEKDIKKSREEWSTIRRKNIKDIMYEKFAIDMKRKYSLTIKQCKFLLAIIFISIMFKTISSKDITYKDDKIYSINGIEFSKGKINIINPIFQEETTIEGDNENDNSEYIYENWNKYLDNIRAIID